MRRKVWVASATVAATALLAACGSSDTGSSPGDENGGEISGTITVLTNRTDIVDTVLQDYADEFEAQHPGTEVQFEALTDYEGDVTTRLSSQNYGDVLLVPNTVTPDQLPTFFEPLGTVAEMGETYRFLSDRVYEDQVYGLATFGSAMGYVYNTEVFAAAGVTEPPRTSEEFLDALQAVADETDAVPYYTNYADGWPLSSWQSTQGTIDGPEAVNMRTEQDAPWTPGNEQYEIDSLLYQIVERGFSEQDPTTTNWEESKDLIGTGQIGAMVLGSWAVPQMQDAAEANGNSRDVIGFWPMPWEVDGQLRASVNRDYSIGVSRHSENKATARAWLDFFVNETDFAEAQGGLSPIIDGPLPTTLADFEEYGVELVELAPVPAGEESLLSDIFNRAEIDLNGDQYRREFIDVARGAVDGDMDSVFADLNSRWAEARTVVNEG
ncbi:extracellular solute-binding protein [Georgenia phoenicis]|uniref:ABC transporter substrate-binding protein n=1 Tax=unclassified Georgenia TaxID=2626815 RepID=UPI0039AF7E25